MGRLAEGAFDGLLADVAARRLSTGRQITHEVTEIEAPLCGLPVGTPVEFLIVPAEQLPSDIWPVLLVHRPVGILAEVHHGEVTALEVATSQSPDARLADLLRAGDPYYLVLRAAPDGSAGYVGHLRFERQSGERGARMPLSAIVVGDRVVLTAREGRFDRSGRAISARLDGRGTLVLTNCLDRLQQVMSWDLASDCTLRLER